MNESIFRQKSLDRISSPEEIDNYMKVTRSSLWLTLGVIVLLLAALILWSVTARVEATAVVDGQTVPVIGRVCMDMLMLRLPAGSRAARGDIVTVFGNGPVTADDLAAAAGTISYEVLCAVAHRVPRIYLG